MRRDVDRLAADILDLEEMWSADEWARVEALARSLVEEARWLQVEPRGYAADRLVSLAASLDEDAPLADDAEEFRADLALAAALVWVGRVLRPPEGRSSRPTSLRSARRG